MSLDPYKIKKQLNSGKGTFSYWSLASLQDQGYRIKAFFNQDFAGECTSEL